jgi:hypothetical protein
VWTIPGRGCRPLGLAEALGVRGRVRVRLANQHGMVCSCGRANCNSPAKHPVGHLVPNGIKGVSTKPEMVEGLFRDSPWNIGIVTGAATPNFQTFAPIKAILALARLR